jgi:rhodanese-related sulfurtransferase
VRGHACRIAAAPRGGVAAREVAKIAHGETLNTFTVPSVIERMLAEARERIRRYTPEQAAAADVLIVDLRSNDERARDGIVPGSIHVPRSVLEWRCDQTSGHANPHLANRTLALLCAHGYSSSLAAASLVDLGLTDAGDVVGGFGAWVAAGLPVLEAPATDGVPGMGAPE